MRQITIRVPQDYGGDVVAIAEQYKATNVAHWPVRSGEDEWELITLHVSNHNVGSLIGDLDSLPDVHINLLPQDVYPLAPPASQVPQQITDVTPHSPMEIWLNALQSIGSWKGFVGYAVAAGVVVWIGMFTNTLFLLVAAMLLAPFAGPAMNVAIASAAGASGLLGRSLLRYVVALIVTVLTTAAVSLIYGQQSATTTMVDVSELSSVAILLPLVAGAAGAHNLAQTKDKSLVSGTAVGLLIAASLAPPAGLIGMAGALARWDMVFNGVFILLLQLLAINLAGSLVFRAYGLRPAGERYSLGRPLVFHVSVALSALFLAGMLTFQFSSTPSLQRSTRAQEAVGIVQEIVDNSQTAELVEANMRFTRPAEQQQETLLAVIYVHRKAGITLTQEVIQRELTTAVQQALLARGYNVLPLVDIVVLEGPEQR